jgi:hypothetical protein
MARLAIMLPFESRSEEPAAGTLGSGAYANYKSMVNE